MADILRNPQEYIQNVFKEDDDSTSEDSDPVDAITTIQKDNKIRVPSLEPALCLMDLHDLPRRDVHHTLFETLKEMLISKLEVLEPRSIKRLLDKSFAFVNVPELRQVVMKILETMPKPINEKYLLDIAEKSDLYRDCPLGIKQDIWRINPGVFGEAVSPLLDQYVAEKENVLFGMIEVTKESVGYLRISPKTRRQNLVLKQLVEMLGSSLPLYNTLCQFLRTLFLRTHVSHYSTLRSDLIMVLHEQDNEITDGDRCHKFAWCLDACVRVSGVDDKKLKELYSFLDSIEGGDEVLEDVSMLLNDPYAQYAISQAIIQTLNKMITEYELPRANQTLQSLARLLSIGCKAISYLDTKAYAGDPLDIDVMTKFLPELLNIMTESQLKSIHVKLKQEYSLYAPSKNFSTYLATYPAAMEITCTYILHLLEKKEFRTITTLLPSVAAACQSGEGVSFPEGFLHMLVTWICSKIDTISENVLYAILKQLFVACCGHSESVLLYLCHLLWVVHHKIKPTILNEILEEMDPGDTVNMAAQEEYQALLKRIEESSSERPSDIT